jgi:isopropylmalate/homocitrate/citramalate synthase
MPLSPGRPPLDPGEKCRRTVEAARAAQDIHPRAGVGFPHATQAEIGFLEDICGQAAREGVERITLYDTNGGSDPFEVLERVSRVREAAGVPIGFHAHNDLGMATANSLAAVRAGATCLDVTVNGLGDRAGNASLEQVAVALSVRGVDLGLRLELLKELSTAVEAMTGVPVSPLAPVVGSFAFVHKSPNHLGRSHLFEAFDPSLVRAQRREVTD